MNTQTWPPRILRMESDFKRCRPCRPVTAPGDSDFSPCRFFLCFLPAPPSPGCSLLSSCCLHHHL